MYQTKSGSIDVFMIMLLGLLALRGLNCGIDTAQYLRLYLQYGSYNISTLFSISNHEIGYKILNKVVDIVFGDYQFLLIISAFLCIYPLWRFFKKETENSLLTISLFLTVSPFVVYFSGIRQAIAMSIGVYAWYAAKNRKILKFVFVVLIAMLFHTSAFALLAVYPLYHAKITKKWLWFVIPMVTAMYFFRKPIFNFALNFLWKDYNITEETGAFMILLLLIIFAIYSYVMVDDKSLDQDTIALRNILLLSIVIQIFAMLHPLSMRMNYYFLIFVPILIPKIANRCKDQYRNISKLSIVVMTVFFMCYFIKDVITDNDPLNVFPYIPFWKNP